MKLVNEFVQVTGIRQDYARVKLAFDNRRFENTPEPLTQFKVIADDSNIEDKITQILKGQPAFRLLSKEDWRLPGFFTVYGDFLAVGGDSYLAWFLSSVSIHNLLD
jgi:hypothetical protein